MSVSKIFLASKKQVFTIPGGQIDKDFFATSEDKRLAEIGKNRMIVPSSSDIYRDLIDQVIEKNNVILFAGHTRRAAKEKGTWYRAEETVMYESFRINFSLFMYVYFSKGMVFGGVMANRKSPYVEQLQYHLFRYDDVRLISYQ